MAGRYVLVAARFNEFVTKALVAGAKDALAESGVGPTDVDLVWVPGAFELPLVAQKAAQTGAYAAVICLGAVIKGDTPHFDHVAGQAASGIMKASLETKVPIIFGVLTTDTEDQALSRCGIKGGNKGADAARSAVATVKALATVDQMARGNR